MKFPLSLGVVVLLAACARPEPLGPSVVVPAEPGISASEIRQGVVGRTGIGPMTGSQAQYMVYLAPDGSAQLKLPTGVERGRWQVSDNDQLCLQWEYFRDGDNYCQRVYRSGDRFMFVDQQSAELLDFRPGKTF